jgi:hypothetical protein
MPRSRFRSMLWSGLALSGTLTTETAMAQENYATWGQHRFILLDTRATAADIPVMTRAVPILIRLTDANFGSGFTESFGRGADLRFTKLGDTVRLPHQTERWDSAARQAEIWVWVDTVKADHITALRMHWSKAGAADSARGSSVFRTADGFQAVYHMNSGSTGSEMDATANAFIATASGAPGTAEGIVGPARTFNNPSNGNDLAGQYLTLANSSAGALDFSQIGTYSLSAWFKSTQNGSNGKVIVGKGDYQYAMHLNLGTNLEGMEFEDAVGWRYAATGTPSTDVWHHAVTVRDGSDLHLYLDGNLVADAPALYASGEARKSGFNVSIGALLRNDPGGNGPGNTRGWIGSIDEVRLSSAYRNGGWVRLEYENQKANQTLVSISYTLPAVALNPARNSAARHFRILPFATGYVFDLEEAGAGTRMTLTDLRGAIKWKSTTNAQGQIHWNGNFGGRKAPPGIYLLRVEPSGVSGHRDEPFTRKISISP